MIEGNANALQIIVKLLILTTMKLLITLSIFIFSALFVFSQNNLTGTVTDKSDSKPLANANVYISDLKIGAATDESGKYSFQNIPKGTYVIEARLTGYSIKTATVKIEGSVTQDFILTESENELGEVVVTGNSSAADPTKSPQPTTEVSNEYLTENASTNVIDAISKVPCISAMTSGQSVAKPVIRGLGYNRVLTVNDGVVQQDQVWFDEFGIEIDPNSVDRVEILKGPASLAYGSDAISGVINFLPEKPLPEGEVKGEIMNNYQTNNGLINNMLHVAGTNNGISWSGRVDNIMAHAYQNSNDGYVLNSQFSNFNADGTIGLHRKWGYTQVHASYFEMQPGIIDGTRDSATGKQLMIVYHPDLNGGAPTYEFPTKQQLKSYTPLVINQRIRHTKVVWDNSIAVGKGRIKAIFSYQKNQRQETNDPTQPDTPDIYYSSNAVTFDLRYVSPQMGGFNYSVGTNGSNQVSQSLGTFMLIPNYNLFQVGGFAIANENIGKLTLSGGLRYDTRKFTGVDHWVDTTQVPVAPNTPYGVHEFQGFTSTFSGMSGSIGATYKFTDNIYVKGNVAQGFRAPNVAECGANGVHDGTPIWELGDQNLKPETSIEEDFAFGINSKDISFEADIFNNNISDFIYAKSLKSVLGGDSLNNTFNGIGLGPAPVYKYTQSKANLYGGEVALDIHPEFASWIDLYSTLSMVDGGLVGVADSIKYLPFVPPTRITVDLKFHIKKMCGGIKNAYIKFGMINCSQQSHVYEQSAIYSGLSASANPIEYAATKAAGAGYTLFSAGVGGDLQSKGHTFCKLYIVVNNLLDTPYMDYMSRFKYLPVNYANGKVGVFNMGRNISFKLIIPFDIKK